MSEFLKLQVVTCLLLFMTSGVMLAQVNRPASAGLPTAMPVANYGGPAVGLLNQAYRQIRSGQFNEAIMTYDAIDAQRPDWLPSLVGRSTLLQRTGANAEAGRYRDKAYRIDPVATGFLMAKGRNALLRYLALYPESALPDVDMTDEEMKSFSRGAYFDQQLETIISLPDSITVNKILQAKVAGDRIKSTQLLHSLMKDREISVDLGFMLEGNLDMLNHDYLAAVASYNQAIDLHGNEWPEITYNRGLAFILLNNYTNGCAELDVSARQGFAPANKMLRSLCTF